MINCLLAGVGGQGTVLASKIIAQAALNKGLEVRTSETIGMAQRGGCVVSHVRIGNEIHSPLIPPGAAHIIIGFEPAEAVRHLPYLMDGGTVVVSKNDIKPVTDSLAKTNYSGGAMISYLKDKVENLVVIDGDTIAAQCGSTKVLNTALLGAAIETGILGLTMEDMRKIIEEKLPQKFTDVNLCALKAGAETLSKEIQL